MRLVHDGREHGWWESYTEGVQPERYILDVPGRYASLENDARVVRSSISRSCTGLLQTEAYSRAVIEPVLPTIRQRRSTGSSRCDSAGQEAIRRRVPAPVEMVALRRRGRPCNGRWGDQP